MLQQIKERWAHGHWNDHWKSFAEMWHSQYSDDIASLVKIVEFKDAVIDYMERHGCRRSEAETQVSALLEIAA